MKKLESIPMVSVILSTYNGKKEWVRKCIDSVYSQTFKNFEFIIINDNSTNGTDILIFEYMKRYNNIVYIKNDKNLGLTKSLNIGIKTSRGKYIARIDDDDYWITEDKLERQVNFMENNVDYGLCGAGKIVRIDENDMILFTEFKSRLSNEEIRNHLLQQNQFVHSGVLIRKSVLDEVGYYNTNYIIAQDYELWCRIGKNYKLVNLSDVSIAYREHKDSISMKKSKAIKTIASKVFWSNKNNYPNFYKALFLRLGAFLLPENIRVWVRRRLNPNLAVVDTCCNQNKNNVLVLNYEFPPLGGGGGAISYDISKGYVDFGHCVDVVTMGFKELPKYEERDGINIFRVQCLRGKSEVCYWREQLTYLIFGYFKLRELLKNKKYDICHCHFLIPTGILAFLLKKRYGIKYIITAHGSDVPGYNPDRFTFIHKFTPRLLRLIINNAEMVFTPSQYLVNLIKRNIKGINKTVQVISNGIDTSKFIPLKKEKIIVGTGRLWPLKGLHLLVEAFSKINNANGYKLHICGDGPLMGKINEIKKCSKNKIVLHGWISNKSKEFQDLLGKSFIFCLPSVSESGSLSLIEGMSCGAAIVTTDIGVCSEMAKDVGFYVDPNVESIKNKLEYLIGNEEICIKNGKKAREKAIKLYDKKLVIEKYIRVCEKFL